MKRIIVRGLMFLAVLLAALYAGDWAVLQMRMAHRTAFSTVQVDQFVAAPLKGNKEEYYHVGTVEQSCVKSLFPHLANPPCWWLERHTTQWKTVARVALPPEGKVDASYRTAGTALHKLLPDEVFLLPV